MIRGPLPSCAGDTQPPQNPSTHAEIAGDNEDEAEKEEEEEQEKKGRNVRLDLIHRRKEGLESSREKPCLLRAPPSSTHTHTYTLDTGHVWLCGGLVWLANRFTSIHHRWLTCAFTGRYCRFGHCLSNIMQRWLSVHGNWRSER